MEQGEELRVLVRRGDVDVAAEDIIPHLVNRDNLVHQLAQLIGLLRSARGAVHDRDKLLAGLGDKGLRGVGGHHVGLGGNGHGCQHGSAEDCSKKQTANIHRLSP